MQAILFNFWLTGTKEEIQQLKVKLQNHFSINNKAIPSNKTTNNTNTNKIESQNEVYDASKYRKHAWKGGKNTLSNQPSFDDWMISSKLKNNNDSSNTVMTKEKEKHFNRDNNTNLKDNIISDKESLCMLKDVSSNNARWGSLKIISKKELCSSVSSHLIIVTNKMTYVIELSPVSLYFADGLCEWYHYRETGKAGKKPSICESNPHYYIPATVNEFMDPLNNFDIIQPSTTIFEKHKHILCGNLLDFMKLIIKVGVADDARSSKQFRVSISCGGLNFEDDNTLSDKITGQNLVNKLSDGEQKMFKEMLGSFMHFIWLCLVDIQNINGRPPPAFNETRYKSYAKKLCDYLGLKEDMRFEIATLVVGVLSHNAGVDGHTDTMNDWDASYRKTGTLSFCMKDNHGVIYMFQVTFSSFFCSYIKM